MNNQAAQTMPSLIDRVRECHAAWAAYNAVAPGEDRAVGTEKLLSEVLASLSQTAGVADVKDRKDAERYRWLRDTQTSYGISAQYDDAGSPLIWLRFSGYGSNGEGTDAAIDRAMLAAAPAASGGEPPSAASVSERARELLAAQYDAEGWDTEANACRRGISDAVDRFALRALEQALTQQPTASAEHWHGLYRKECRLRQDDAARYGQQIVDLESALTQQRWALPSAETFASAVWRDWMTNEQADKLGAELHAWLVAHIATTPHPSADAVRELVARWRDKAKRTDAEDRADDALEFCADELEAALTREAPTEVVGGVIVPRDPTLDMLNAGWREIERQGLDPESVEMLPIYHAMVTATPPAPQQQSAEKECTCKAGEGCTESCSRGWRRILSEAGQLPPSSRQSVLDFICREMEKLGAPQRQSAKEVAIVCDWKDADPFPRFIEAEVDGCSVSLEWRDREDGLRELIVPAHTQSDYPGCSGDPASCPENEGYGCCKPNPPRLAQGEDDRAAAILSDVLGITVNGREPTHYCTHCGALWLSGNDYWSLVSLHCGKCCDNQPMTPELIKPLLRWREWPGMGHVLMPPQVEAKRQTGDDHPVLRKALANPDWCGPAAHFRPEEEVIQTRVLRALLKQHDAAAAKPSGEVDRG